jgi:hypothetical protein
MKFLVLLFNLYLLVLPCLPCGDVDDCANEKPTTVSLQKGNNPKEEHKSDNCTPFCHCACCTSPVTFLTHTIEKNIVTYFIKKNYILQSTQYATNSTDAIWQPPKQTTA